MKEMVIGNSQHRLTKRESHVTNLRSLVVMRRLVLWVREDQGMSSALTWARFMTGSLTLQLYPIWDIIVRRDSMTARGWSTCPRRRG